MSKKRIRRKKKIENKKINNNKSYHSPQFYDFGFPTPKVVEIRFYKAHIVNEAETELSIVANTERGRKRQNRKKKIRNNKKTMLKKKWESKIRKWWVPY